MSLRLEVDGAVREVRPDAVIVAGFSGRDRAAVEAHIAELAELGVPAPSAVPSFYRLPRHLLCQWAEIEVAHPETSGEAEVALIADRGELLVTLASDHTDRRAERLDIDLAKQACPKVIAGSAWPFDGLRARWDELVLRSWITVDGVRERYQEGAVASLLRPDELLARSGLGGAGSSFVVLGGTIAVRGAVRPADRFAAELHDPAAGRSIRLAYDVRLVQGAAAADAAPVR